MKGQRGGWTEKRPPLARMASVLLPRELAQFEFHFEARRPPRPNAGSDSLARPVGLITPSYSDDFERFSLLCDSIDRRVVGYERHYVIVSDDDIPLFRPFASERRIVLPSSRFLPRWLRLAPWLRLANGRKIWWSLRARPIHGWHVQQIVKIAAAMEMPEQRFCLIDLDIVFARPFDVGAYASGERSRSSPARSDQVRRAAARRMDAHLRSPSWPCRDLLPGGRLHRPRHRLGQGRRTRYDCDPSSARPEPSWPLALCRTRHFSEYLLYGRHVRNSPERLAEHEITTQSRAASYWDGQALTAPPSCR